MNLADFDLPCSKHSHSYGPEVCANCLLELCQRADALELAGKNLRVQVDALLKRVGELPKSEETIP